MRKGWMVMVVLGLAFWGCARNASSGAAVKSVRVRVQSLEHRDFTWQIPVKGTVTPVEFATISAKREGTLEKLSVDEGSQVKRGGVLFGVDRQNLENLLKQAEASIGLAEAELAQAQESRRLAELRKAQAARDAVRARQLRVANAGTQAELEDAELALQEAESTCQTAALTVKSAEAKLKTAQASGTIARKDWEDAELAAPFDCVVTEKYVEEGEYVKAGTAILKLENLQHLQIEAYASSAYYDLVVPGKTRVRLSAGGETQEEAVVTYRSETVDPASRTFKVKVALPSGCPLHSGTLCDVSLVLARQEGYGLPEAALLLRYGGKYEVFAVDDQGKAEALTVEKGIIDGLDCEIPGAAQWKDRKFVVEGQRFVTAGDRLTLSAE